MDRAIATVERALELYGPPVYVRHEIVHNQYVIKALKHRGAIFVEETTEVPEGSVVIFSAHGVAPTVHQEAARRHLTVIDATCPLVTKVHKEAARFAREGHDILLIGHEGHEEVIGTTGEAPEHIQVVDSPDDVQNVKVRKSDKVAWLSQTTLSVDETMKTVDALKEKFPQLISPPSDDICYATQNRQLAVKQMAAMSELVIVVGSTNSSNSVRLVEVAQDAGAPSAHLVDHAEQIDEAWLRGVTTVGVTSGASVPESLVDAVLRRLASHGYVNVETVTVAEEHQHFALPRELTSPGRPELLNPLSEAPQDAKSQPFSRNQEGSSVLPQALAIELDETQAFIPELALPFPERTSPHQAYAERSVLRWARRTGLVADRSEAHRMASHAWGHCAAVAVPRASRTRLSLMACWLAWMGVLDDTAETHRTHASFTEAAEGIRAVLADDNAPIGHPLVAAFTDLDRRTRRLGSPAWTGRHSETTAQLLDGLVDEQRVKQEGLPSVAEYVERRRITGYMPMLYNLTEIALRCELPSTVRESGPYERLVTASTDAADFINDIYTLRKELAHGETGNLVIVLAHEQGLTIEQALHEAALRTRQAVDDFQTAEQDLHSALTAHSMPVHGWQATVTMVDTMHDWIAGLPAYYRTSGRYHRLAA